MKYPLENLQLNGKKSWAKKNTVSCVKRNGASTQRNLQLHYEEGTYCCGACSEPLFESNSKFDAHCVAFF
jgi:peptide-methionine (R)-S-oxide reductase